MPTVSIITPLYNGAGFIGQTIRSVMSQTYTDWEMIIVDDCSRDQPEKIILPYVGRDQRIRLIRLNQNQGAAAARNHAFDLASGDFIAFLDGDDIWKPEKLAFQIGWMKQNDRAFSFTSYEIIKHDGSPAGKIIHAPEKIDYRHYLRNTVIGCLTVVIDRRKTGPFKMPLIGTSHDMALWLDMMKRGIDAYGIDEVLASYRLVSTSNTANKFKAAKGVWHVYRAVEKLAIFPSLINFSGYLFHAAWKRL